MPIGVDWQEVEQLIDWPALKNIAEWCRGRPAGRRAAGRGRIEFDVSFEDCRMCARRG